MGLDISLYKYENATTIDEEDSGENIEFNSSIDPEHFFKIGYFRSSYNNGGINHVLRNLGIPDLYDIFDAPDEYCFKPDWNKALIKVDESINLLLESSNYRCFDITQNMFSKDGLPQSEKEAMDLFAEEIKSKTSFDGYSNGKGHFYHKDPIKVLALIPGEHNILGKSPCTYVIIEGENEYYLTALRIVKETIEYVLTQPDNDKYYLHWSS